MLLIFETQISILRLRVSEPIRINLSQFYCFDYVNPVSCYFD